MAVVQKNAVTAVSTGSVGVGLLEGERFEIKTFGKTVNVRNTIYDNTNFYIGTSRDYVGDHKLTRYVYIIYIQWVYLGIFLVSFLTPLNYIFAFVMAVVHLLFLLVWIQHAYVNLGTMPYVLHQPSLPNHLLNNANDFFEITLEKYVALFAASSNAGIGIAAKAKGTIKIQVFKTATIGKMRNCIAVSTLALIGCLLMIIYCFAWGVVKVVQEYANDSE